MVSSACQKVFVDWHTRISEVPVEQEPGKPTAPDIINALLAFYSRATSDSSSVTDLDARRLCGSTEDALAEKSAPERKHAMATPSREQPAVPNPKSEHVWLIYDSAANHSRHASNVKTAHKKKTEVQIGDLEPPQTRSMLQTGDRDPLKVQLML